MKNHIKRFEDEIPCLDIKIDILNSEIQEIQNKKFISAISNEEYQYICDELKKEMANDIALCFEDSKRLGADVFLAYDTAIKFNFKTTNKYYDSMEEFLDKLKLNVEIDIKKFES